MHLHRQPKAPNGSTIYVGTYVDKLIHYGEDDELEKWFEYQLKQHINVNFLGAISWCLGIYYEWDRTNDDRLTFHLSQEAMVYKMLPKEGPEECNAVSMPYQSGLPINIDRGPHDRVKPKHKKKLVKRYQSIMGGLTWLFTQSQPDITAS